MLGGCIFPTIWQEFTFSFCVYLNLVDSGVPIMIFEVLLDFCRRARLLLRGAWKNLESGAFVIWPDGSFVDFVFSVDLASVKCSLLCIGIHGSTSLNSSKSWFFLALNLLFTSWCGPSQISSWLVSSTSKYPPCLEPACIFFRSELLSFFKRLFFYPRGRSLFLINNNLIAHWSICSLTSVNNICCGKISCRSQFHRMIHWAFLWRLLRRPIEILF